jgi:hypothetical protein
MNKSTVYILLLLFLLPTILSGGDYSFDFIDIGIGTRAKSLGGSFVSIANDGSSLLWNPAGSSQISSSHFYFTHNSQFSGMSNIDYISFMKPIFATSYFSIAILRHSVGDIPIFPELEGTPEERDTTPGLQGDGVPMGYFDEIANIYFFNLSKSLPFRNGNLSIGGNFKYFDETIYGTGGTGIGLDIGTILTFRIKSVPGQFSTAITLQDATGTQILWNTDTQRKDIIPTNYRFGSHYKKNFYRIQSTFLFSIDYNTRYEGSAHFGFEYSYQDHFHCDIGYCHKKVTFGTGFRFWKVGIQYGFIPHVLGSSHSISMELIL